MGGTLFGRTLLAQPNHISSECISMCLLVHAPDPRGRVRSPRRQQSPRQAVRGSERASVGPRDQPLFVGRYQGTKLASCVIVLMNTNDVSPPPPLTPSLLLSHPCDGRVIHSTHKQQAPRRACLFSMRDSCAPHFSRTRQTWDTAIALVLLTMKLFQTRLFEPTVSRRPLGTAAPAR